jgi:hypothetical protein
MVREVRVSHRAWGPQATLLLVAFDTPRDRQTDYMPMCQGRPAPHARDQSLGLLTQLGQKWEVVTPVSVTQQAGACSGQLLLVLSLPQFLRHLGAAPLLQTLFPHSQPCPATCPGPPTKEVQRSVQEGSWAQSPRMISWEVNC